MAYTSLLSRPTQRGGFTLEKNKREVVTVAKGKYQKWLEPENLILLEGWARDGLTDEQIAHNMGIAYSTFKEWKNKYPAISATLKKGKEVVDTEVENALLQKALGMTKTIQKPIKLKEVLYDNGKRTSEKEHIEFVEEEIFIPPDTTAQIFWLKNRRPDKWRDKQKDEVDTTALVKLDNILQEIKDDAERSTNNAVHD